MRLNQEDHSSASGTSSSCATSSQSIAGASVAEHLAFPKLPSTSKPASSSTLINPEADLISPAPKPGSVEVTPRLRSQVLAAAAAGLFSDALTHPLDTLRTHLQTSVFPRSPRILYRGFGVIAFMSAPAHAAYLTSYDICKNTLPPFLAGATAEVAGALLFVPEDVLKKRSMLAQKGYQGISEVPGTICKIVRTEGLRGLYAGYVPAALTWMPFSAVYFSVFEGTRNKLKEHNVLHEHGVKRDFVSAATAAATAAFVTAPIDLIATRVQTKHGGARNARQVVSHLVKENGRTVKPFFAGALARVAWLAPQAAVSLTVFESLKYRIEELWA